MTEPKLKPVFVSENSDEIEHDCALCGNPLYIERLGYLGCETKVTTNCTQPKCDNAHKSVIEVYKRFSFLFRNRN